MMRAGGNSSCSNNHQVWNWDSPLPYLFGGLALISGLIGIALIILSCANRSTSSSSSSLSSSSSSSSSPEGIKDDDDEKDDKPPMPETKMAMNFVVIMAGDEDPTYLATPSITTAAYHSQQVSV